MKTIQRLDTNARMSQVVVHGDTAYLAGMLANTFDGDVVEQTQQALANIEAALTRVGSDKSKLLSAQIWLKNIDGDFKGMNKAWENWLPSGAAPTRATCQAQMAAPEILVEIIVTAAISSAPHPI